MPGNRTRNVGYTGRPCPLCREFARRGLYDQRIADRRRYWRREDDGWERGEALRGFTRPGYWD